MKSFISLVTVLLVWLLPFAALADDPLETLIRETGIETGPVAVRDMPGWSEPRRVAIRAPEGVTQQLREAFPELEIIDVATAEELAERAPDAAAVIGFCSQDVIDAAAKLVWIQIFTAGAERCVSLEAVRSGRVLVTNMQKMSSPVLAEHAIAMVMALARGLVAHGKAMQAGEWERRSPVTDRMQTVAGQTLLVVGLGGIGTEVARRGAALGMRVTATRRSSRSGPDFVDYVGLSSELHALAAEADFIVNALPLTPETEGLFDKKFFAAAKRGTIFVSVGRGGSTVTGDLIKALESGQVGGAGLDVTDPEPLPADNPLWRMDNVLITPHVAGVGGSRDRHVVLLRENLRRFIAGDALYNVVDPGAGY
jgi:phosphoglycerate dehydrogenase-like enzyme